MGSLSWAAYNASSFNTFQVPDISSLLRIWRESSKSPAMIKHAIDVIIRAIRHLNPSQTPVITFDQPLYAIAKSIQWCYPHSYGIEKLVVMMGPLHIEMAFLSVLGDWLESSGWTTLIQNAGVTRPGVAQSLLSGHDVVRTKYTHQITVCTLYTLIQKAYNNYASNTSSPKDFSTWRHEMEQSYPQFRYWSIAMTLEVKLLSFLKSVRKGDFYMYKDALKQLLPWFFALDHFHYARWLTIHWYEMATIYQTNPDINKAFQDGCFVINRTSNPFSSMGIDQCHEQLNKIVKGDGGAIGLTEDEDKLRRWTVCGPEVARVVTEFEDATVLKKTDSLEYRHHEETPMFQKRFKEHYKSLVQEFEKLGNPFICISDENDLIQLDTRDILGQEVVNSINEIEELGKLQADKFIKERIVEKTSPITAPIKKNKFPLFSSSNTSSSQTTSRKEKQDLKKDVKMFAQLYIATQVRGGDIQDLFNHETRKEPPSLAKSGEIRSGVKADLLSCIKAEVLPAQTEPNVEAVVLEGSVLVNIAKPGNEKTFSGYANNIFFPMIKSEIAKVNRVDVVFDTYRENSLKSSARAKRGKGIRRKVENNSEPPKNWRSFLRINDNKTELFRYLSKYIITTASHDMNIVCAYDDTVISNQEHDLSAVAPCNQEEGDTRVFLHVQDMVRSGYRVVKVRTVDTDVIVIGVAVFGMISGLQELWIEFGTGNTKQYYPIHELHQKLGADKAKAMAFFHALTGCDQVSFFCSCKKTKAWNTWVNFPEVTEAFIRLGSLPTKECVKESMPIIERFTALMYKRTTNCSSINEARREMFVKDGRDLENIPPTAGALYQHVLRASFIAGHVWHQSLIASPSLPNIEDWGWKLKKDMYIPNWTDLQEASAVVRELVRCGCKPEKGCSGRCKCLKAELMCTELCKCNGECETNS